MNFPHCLHIGLVIGKYTDFFRVDFSSDGGEGSGITWEDLSVEEFIMGEENFDELGAGFSSIIKKNNNEKLNKKASFFN